jgi:hypothetical protein
MDDEPKDVRVPFMTTATQVASVDEWRRSQKDMPPRAEAIRRLIEAGLAAQPKTKKSR